MSITNLLQRLLRLLRLPLAGMPRMLRTEDRLVRLTQEHTRDSRDLRREIEDLDRQIERKEQEIAAETRLAVLAVLRSELHSLVQSLERRSTRIGVLTDQRNHVGSLLEKLQVARLAAGKGAVSIDEIDAITTQVENAAGALEDRREAMRDLDATTFATDYQAPELHPTTSQTKVAEAVLTPPAAVPPARTTPTIATETEDRTNR